MNDDGDDLALSAVQKRRADALAERSISPPPLKKSSLSNGALQSISDNEVVRTECQPSPFRLTRVSDLPDNKNADTVTLTEIIGSPLVRECWFFDYLYDVDWVSEKGS